jgi:peptidyl-prolyl cis-trans isomerase SurA
MTQRRPFLPLRVPAAALAAVLLAGLGLAATPAAAQVQAPRKATAALGGASMDIVAVVNGDVISQADVENRRRLFALSSGLPVTDEVLNRLTPQVIRELIDERLRLQESQRRRIVVQDKQVAAALAEIEQRNNMPPGGLARQLSANGVALRTLIDQIRTQLAWAQVVRAQVAESGPPTPAEIADQEAQLKAQIGKPEYRVAEIFVPVANPGQDQEARRFSDTIIQQLRAGAPFPVVAAEFSQSQTALQGGDMGWLQGSELDPSVQRVVGEMPVGAISNPLKVPGGYSIVTLRGKREVGRDMGTLMHVRQVWLPFQGQLNPQAPTPEQIAVLEKARRLTTTIKSCPDAEAANKAAGDLRPSDPGEIRLEAVSNPNLRDVLARLQAGQISPPLPNPDGISLIFVCSRESKNFGIPTKDQLAEKILNERVELASRQLMRDLQRKAVIDQRS